MFLSICREFKRGDDHNVSINVKCQILLSVPQKWRQTPFIFNNPYGEKEILRRAEKKPCFLWKTGDKRWSRWSSGSHSSTLHHQTPPGTAGRTSRPPAETSGRLAAMLLWGESVVFFLLVFKKASTERCTVRNTEAPPERLSYQVTESTRYTSSRHIMST